MQKPITPELIDKVYGMRDTFTDILDNHGSELNGALRVKLAKAELLLNRVALLMDQSLTESKVGVDESYPSP